MSKTFRPWDVDQAWLLPLSLLQFVPAGHPAHVVRDALDLSAITGIYKSEQGQPPHHPGMLVALLLYGDSRIMPAGGGLIAGCNGRIAVGAAHQIIVAQRLATNPAASCPPARQPCPRHPTLPGQGSNIPDISRAP